MTTTASYAPARTDRRTPRPRRPGAPARATRTVVFVGAHPDDDTFSISGTIALLRHDAALRFVLVLATDGEAGEIADDVAVTPSELARHRRGEDADSWRTVGRVPDRTVWLGLPDGGLDQLPGGLLANRIATVLREERPDVVATFGPDGLTGHADHVAVGAATTAAFLDLAQDRGPGPSRLLHTGIPQSRFDAWNDDLASASLPTWDPTPALPLPTDPGRRGRRRGRLRPHGRGPAHGPARPPIAVVLPDRPERGGHPPHPLPGPRELGRRLASPTGGEHSLHPRLRRSSHVVGPRTVTDQGNATRSRHCLLQWPRAGALAKPRAWGMQPVLQRPLS